MDQRVLKNLPMVHAMAVRAHAQLPGNIDLTVLIQAGLSGLTEAALQAAGKDNVGFLTYAKHRIRGSILNSLRPANSGSSPIQTQD